MPKSKTVLFTCLTGNTSLIQDLRPIDQRSLGPSYLNIAAEKFASTKTVETGSFLVFRHLINY